MKYQEMSSVGLKAFAFVLLTALSACGGGGAGSSDLVSAEKNISGSVVKGPITNATIHVRKINPVTGFISETIEASATTDGNGNFNLDLTALTGALIIESLGGSFIDESDQNNDGGPPRRIQLGPQNGLRIYRPAGLANISITMLTDAMTSRAFTFAQENQISVDNAFSAVRALTNTALGFDPLTTIAVSPLAPNTTDANQIKYALVLGGMAQAANQLAIKVGFSRVNSAVISAFIDDLSDGKLDGKLGDQTLFLNQQAMPDIDLAAAIKTFRNNNKPVYPGNSLPVVDEQQWSQTPQPNNAAPSIALVQGGLSILEGQTLVLNSNVLTVSDAETATEDLRFIVLQPPGFGGVSDDQGPLGPDAEPVAQLQYNNFQYPQGGVDTLVVAVVDEDNGYALTPVPIVVNGRPVGVPDNVSTAEDTLITIDVLANDTDPENQALSISGITNPINGVPSINGNQINFSPAANFNGSAGFNYQMTDGAYTVTVGVNVNVTAVNDLPTISGPGDQVIAEDNVLSGLPVVVGDVETPANGLLVTGVSNNPALLPNGNISITGTGENRSVSLTPAPNQNGSVQVTLIVDDGVATSSDSFVLTVTPVDDAPTISSIADQTIAENTSTSPLAFTVNDPDVAATELIVSAVSSNQVLLPDGNIVLAGTGVNRSIGLTPAQEEFGTAVVTVTVSDGGLAASTSFTLTVNNLANPVMYVAPTALGDGNCLSPSNACDSPSQAIAAATAGAEVWMATGTYPIASLAERLTLKNQVLLRGGYNVNDYAAMPSDDPRDTVLQATFAQSGQGVIECRNGISNQTKVEGLDIQASNSGETTIAVNANGSCNAVFHNNVMRGGAGSIQSIALRLQTSTGAVVVADGNFIDGGSSASDSLGVIVESGGLILKNSKVYGGMANASATHGVTINSSSTETVTLENNLISGGNTQNSIATGLLFEFGGSANVVNNTIYGGAGLESVAVSYSDNSTTQSQTAFINNIFFVDNSAPNGAICIQVEVGGVARPNVLHNNLFSQCSIYAENGTTYSTRTEFKDFLDAGDPPPAIDLEAFFEGPLSFVDPDGADNDISSIFDNDWHLTADSGCESTHGGVSNSTEALAPTLDIDEAPRTPVGLGRCAYVEKFLEPNTLGDIEGLSLGAYEFDVPARYVSNTGDDTGNCSNIGVAPSVCATIERALEVAQPGDEIRIATGNYTLSGASNAFPLGRITKPVSVVGGYEPNFFGYPRCNEEVCNTQVNLKATAGAAGANRNAVVVCDGTAGGFTQDNTLIAGLSIDGTDTTKEFNEVHGLIVTNSCNATVASNRIVGSDCGLGSNHSSYGLTVDAPATQGTVPRIFDNAIAGGKSCLTEAVGINISDNTLPTAPNNRLVVARNQIVATDLSGSLTERSIGIAIGSGAQTSTGSILIVENKIDASRAIYSVGIKNLGFGDVNINANVIYGGVAGTNNLNVFGSAIGIQAEVYGELQIYNNFIHGGSDALQDSSAFTQGVRVGGIGTSGKLQVRNNTIFSGVSPNDTQRTIVLGPALADGDLSEVFIDNNILFTPLSVGLDRRCIEEEKAVTPNRVANNLFYNCDALYFDKVGTAPSAEAGANSAANNATGNLVVGMGGVPAPSFVDEDGLDNDLASSDFDWHLTNGEVCDIAEGALDGTAQSPMFIYTNDFDMDERTGNGVTGWTIGADEQNICGNP